MSGITYAVDEHVNRRTLVRYRKTRSPCLRLVSSRADRWNTANQHLGHWICMFIYYNTSVCIFYESAFPATNFPLRYTWIGFPKCSGIIAEHSMGHRKHFGNIYELTNFKNNKKVRKDSGEFPWRVRSTPQIYIF